ncbi:MAG: S49 family peptidase [Propionibacterium sp.]|nr:S49 family peptidase [Propionibacterium sp.]
MSDNPEHQDQSFSPVSEPAPPVAGPQQPQGPAPYAPASRPGYAPAPPKQPSGFGRGFGKGLGFALGLGVVAIVATVIAGFMAIASLASITLPTASGTATTQLATVWGDETATDSLRAIDISGTIMADASDGALLGGGTYGYEIADMLDGLTVEDSSGVILLVNTPGGSITGSRAIADAVTRYQDRTGQPVLVHVSSMSASGGVYSTATADEIIADHGALVGSIGIISGPFQRFENVTAIGSTILAAGVEAESITEEYLSLGEGKDFGNPMRDMTEAERTQWMEMLSFEYGQFVGIVSEHRGIDESVIVNDMGAGVFATDQAQEYGLIDGVMGRDEFFRHAAETAGLNPDDTRVDSLSYPAGFLDSLLGIERLYGQSPVVEQGAGVTPSLSTAICGPTSVLAHHGSLTAACG